MVPAAGATQEAGVVFLPRSAQRWAPVVVGSPQRGVVRTQEAVITTPIQPTSWTYAEEFVPEDEILAAARSRAEEVGVVSIGSGVGASLRSLAAVLDARAVVEIGTGTGLTGLWLLRGMPADGVLTTVVIATQHHRLP